VKERALPGGARKLLDVARNIRKGGIYDGQVGLLRFHQVRLILSARAIIARLIERTDDKFLHTPLTQELANRVGVGIRGSRTAFDALEKALERSDAMKHPMAASILHFANSGWKPKTHARNFCEGFFPRAQWPGVVLDSANFTRANLEHAELSRADLRHA